MNSGFEYQRTAYALIEIGETGVLLPTPYDRHRVRISLLSPDDYGALSQELLIREEDLIRFGEIIQGHIPEYFLGESRRLDIAYYLELYLYTKIGFALTPETFQKFRDIEKEDKISFHSLVNYANRMIIQAKGIMEDTACCSPR